MDARDTRVGAWFEAKIIKITKTILEEKTSESGNEDTKVDKNVKTEETNNNSVDINQNSNTVDSMEVDGVNTDNSDVKDEKCDAKEKKCDGKDEKCAINDANVLCDKDTLQDDGFTYHIVFEG